MNRHSLRVATRLVVLCTLVLTFSFVRDSVAHSVAWDDTGYFNALYACDGNCHGTLDDCRANPSYPTNPDENQCRYNAGSSYFDCVSGIPAPSFEMDFCANARAARDNCNWQYGPEGANPDFGAHAECVNASGISQCE
jgi:hypothetical protein